MLMLKYHSDGQNSEYQPAYKASCREGTYPTSTTLTVEGQRFEVSDGDEFTIEPEYGHFSAETYFRFSNSDDDCYIHTSCSVPLELGDQIGPFEIMGDEDCFTNMTKCLDARVGTDNDGDTVITVEFDYAQLDEDRWWAVNACDPRDQDCPGFPLDPLPSDWIGFYPCNASMTTPAFKVEPAFWAYTCYDRSCRRDDVETATKSGILNFSDKTLPDFATQGVYSTIAEIQEKGGGCYVVLLNKMDGFSPPPYYNLCLGNEIMIPPLR